MRVDSGDPELAAHLHRIGRILSGHGGYVAEDFTVRERAGEFSCAVEGPTLRRGHPGRVLVSYPPGLAVPMWPLTWSDSADAMEPVAGLDALAPVHRALLEQWLPLVNRTLKLARIRAVVPQHAVHSWSLRHHLAAAGYSRMRRGRGELDPKDTLIGWHCLGGPAAVAARAPAGPRWRLIPLKHLVNHSPDGAVQDPVPGRIAVAASATSATGETFENYGDLDSLDLAMRFGFTLATPLLHSVPVSVISPAFGQVRVLRRPRRFSRLGGERPQGPASLPDVRVVDDGLTLSHLTLRPGNRAQLVAHLGQVAAAHTSMRTEAVSTRAAEDLLDAIAQANLDYYRRVDVLVAAAGSGEASTLLAMASLFQQQALTTR